MNAKEYQKIAKVGDIIRTNGDSSCARSAFFEATVTEVGGDYFRCGWTEGVLLHPRWYVNFSERVTVDLLSTPFKPLTFMSSVLEKAALMFKGEPQKSFRKAGLTNGDDMLTPEGQTVFLSFLLQGELGKEFKKQVVDPMLAEGDKK